MGPYEVVAQIGAGGMGEVYRAHDARLQRDVAVKVLPESVALDPVQRARFEREAKAVAALSHPNVLAIFDTGSHDGRLYAVTELLEGETLRERLRQGPLPIRKAIDWAVQIAHGLAAAHDKHLVHRDLKPENIFLLADGPVKILDFGLARHTPDPEAATETYQAVTHAGAVLGTVGYMAPEQVRGQGVDTRADLFAFGAVLYEMLTGQRAFRRDTPAETMTAILREDPPALGALRVDLPPALERIVRHCLEKNVNERFQTARDIAFALEALSGSGPADTKQTDAMPTGASAARRPGRGLIGAAMVVAALVLVGLAMWRWNSSREAERGNASRIAIGTVTQVTEDDGLEIGAALSPDGKLLAYASGQPTHMRIFIRPVAGGRTLTLSETGAAFEYAPRWSPDGSQILFLTPAGAYVASALGGAARRVAAGPLGGAGLRAVPGPLSAAAWSPDGKRVLLARVGRLSADSLSIVALNGGGEHSIASGPSDLDLHSCDWSPRNDWVACVSGNSDGPWPNPGFGNIAPSAIVLAPVTGGAFVTVIEATASNLSPAWSSDGRQLYFVSSRDGPRDIYVADIAPDGRVKGSPQRITTGLGVLSVSFAAASQRLVYVTYASRANIWSLPIPSGAAIDTSRALALTSSNQVVEAMRVSRDGQWLLYDSTLHGNAEIFRIPIDGGPPERLTTDPADDFAPDLSPDGRAIVYHSWRSGSRDIYVKPLDGEPLQTITATAAQEQYPVWSPEGGAIAFHDQDTQTLFVVRRNAAGTWGAPTLLRQGLQQPGRGSWLPDGRALAYPRRDGAIEVIPAEPGRPRVVYAPTTSSDPRSRSVVPSDDGRTLFFKSTDPEGRSAIWSVPTQGGKPRLLVRFSDPARPSIRPDFAAGAGRFFFTLEERQADIWVAEITHR